MAVLEKNKIRTARSTFSDPSSVWLTTIKVPIEFQSTASSSNILEDNLSFYILKNENFRTAINNAQKFDQLNEMLDSIRELPFEKLDMDEIIEPTIQKANEILFELNKEKFPLYNISPGRGGEILIELKKNELEVEVFINEDSSIEQLIYNNNQLVFESEYQLALLRVIFK